MAYLLQMAGQLSGELTGARNGVIFLVRFALPDGLSHLRRDFWKNILPVQAAQQIVNYFCARRCIHRSIRLRTLRQNQRGCHHPKTHRSSPEPHISLVRAPVNKILPDSGTIEVAHPAAPMTITRRNFLGAAAGALAAMQAQAKRPPNIVFLLTDDQRWDTLGCMGHPIVRTPNVDSLAREGVLFRNNFCATAICCTSRATIFSGLHETTHRISDFSTALPEPVHARTYPVLLKRAGYRMGFVGKYGVGTDMPAGDYDYWQGLAGQAGTYWHEWKGRRTHLTRMMGEQAIEFLESSSGDRPFCLSVSFKAPHAEDPNPRQYIYDPAQDGLYKDATVPVPKTAAPEYFDRLPDFLKTSEGRVRWGWRFRTPESYQEMVKGYLRLISGVDDVVGDIRSSLHRLGLAGNTVIVYTSDNGYLLGEHGLADKWFMYEESIRTPLVVYDPRLPAPLRGSERTEMALNVDLAPTFVSLAGLQAPSSMQGSSLLPLVWGESPRWRQDWFYSHHFRHKLIPQSEGVRAERWKYIRYIESNPTFEELYDLRADPGETANLAGDPHHRKQLNHLRTRWSRWRHHLADSSPVREYQTLR